MIELLVYTWLDCINGDEERSGDTYYKSVDTIRLKQYLRNKKELKKLRFIQRICLMKT